MPDTLTIVISSLLSGGIAFGLAKWIAERSVGHLLERDLTRYKAGFDEELERLKVSLAQTKESLLGEEAAERSYRFEARKRLYGAVGPLRFQLLIASVRYLSRLSSLSKFHYATGTGSYFGNSIIYRIGRLLAVTELIERQIAYADFSVDPAMMVLLRFRAELLRALSSSDVTIDHPDADWTRQSEHIFSDQIPVLAVSMIVKNADGTERVARYDEFVGVMGGGTTGYLEPLTGIVARLGSEPMPIFRLRMLALGQACEGLLEGEPVSGALDAPALPYRSLLAGLDDHVRSNQKAYHAMLASFRTNVRSGGQAKE